MFIDQKNSKVPHSFRSALSSSGRCFEFESGDTRAPFLRGILLTEHRTPKGVPGSRRSRSINIALLRSENHVELRSAQYHDKSG